MSIDLYRKTMREVDMERTIREAVTRLDGKCWHVRDSRALDVEDMPDLIGYVPATVTRPGRVFLIELKSQRRRITQGQHAVLDDLATCREVVTGIVRPVPDEGEMSLDETLQLLGVPGGKERTG
jgi:hypothetical protein